MKTNKKPISWIINDSPVCICCQTIWTI